MRPVRRVRVRSAMAKNFHWGGGISSKNSAVFPVRDPVLADRLFAGTVHVFGRCDRGRDTSPLRRVDPTARERTKSNCARRDYGSEIVRPAKISPTVLTSTCKRNRQALEGRIDRRKTSRKWRPVEVRGVFFNTAAKPAPSLRIWQAPPPASRAAQDFRHGPPPSSAGSTGPSPVPRAAEPIACMFSFPQSGPIAASAGLRTRISFDLATGVQHSYFVTRGIEKLLKNG